jgi:streptogrisin C
VPGFTIKAVTVLGAMTAALAATTAAAMAEQGTDEGAPLDAAARTYRSVFPQMSDAAARTAATQEEQRKQLYTELTSDNAKTYGGAWYDPPSGVLHVAVTSPDTATEAGQLAKELGVQVETHLVRHSFDELERQANALRNGSNALSKTARGQVGIDVKTNRVVAAVPAQRLGMARTLKAPSAVSIQPDPNLKVEKDAGCTSRDWCDWTVRAGAKLWRGNDGNVCSVGFTARTSTNERFAYTAGHCASYDVDWGTGGQSIGRMAASTDSGSLDASIIRITNSRFTGDSGGEIYHESSPGRSVPLNGVAPSVSYMLQGERVCLAANYTEPNGPNYCGVIGAVSDWWVGGKTRVDGVDACGGDSGGGWYWLTSTGRRVAYGLHSQSDRSCHSAGGNSWYTPIATANAWTGLNVEIRP